MIKKTELLYFIVMLRSLIQTQQCHVGNRINTQRGGIRTLQKQNAHKHERGRVAARVDKKKSLSLSLSHSQTLSRLTQSYVSTAARKKSPRKLGGPNTAPQDTLDPPGRYFPGRGAPYRMCQL